MRLTEDNYGRMNIFQKAAFNIMEFFKALPSNIIKCCRATGRGIVAFGQGVANVARNYCRTFFNGDVFTKISYAVMGFGCAVRGQIVKATIVLSKGYSPSQALAAEIQTYVKSHTAPYKYPRVIEFVDSLPMTISNKIIRRELRKGGSE